MRPGDKRFWTLSRKLRGKRKNQIPFLINGNVKLITDKEKADKLAETFEQSHYLTTHYSHSIDKQVNSSSLTLKTKPP